MATLCGLLASKSSGKNTTLRQQQKCASFLCLSGCNVKVDFQSSDLRTYALKRPVLCSAQRGTDTSEVFLSPSLRSQEADGRLFPQKLPLSVVHIQTTSLPRAGFADHVFPAMNAYSTHSIVTVVEVILLFW